MPTSGSVSQGGSTVATVTAVLIPGPSESVTFSVSGLPSGATASFSPQSCAPICSSTLTISTSILTPAGSYKTTLTAKWGKVTRTTSYDLAVSASSGDTSDKDQFGIVKKNLTIPGGREWFAKCSGTTRAIPSGDRDPLDPEFLVTGDVTEVRVMGDGTLKMDGTWPRFSIHDATGGKKWQNVEQTAYFLVVNQNQQNDDKGIAPETRWGFRSFLSNA